MLQRVIEVEELAERLRREPRGHVRVGGEVVAEGAVAAPRTHRVALHEHVRLLARHARLDEREQHRFGKIELRSPSEVLFQAIRVDDEPLHEAARAIEHERERRGRVGGDHALGRRMRDVALVPERDVLEGRDARSAHHAREAAQVLAEDRVALVRHRARALLTEREGLLGLADLGALPVTDVGGEALDAGGDEGHRAEELGMTVARDHLRAHGLGAEPERGERALLDRRREMRICTDGASDLADRDGVARA